MAKKELRRLARAKAAPAAPIKPGAVETSWWEYSGKMTPFENGISSPLFRPLGGGEEVSYSDLPVGALYAVKNDGNWHRTGPDGLAIAVKLPDGHWWNIDSQAGNCRWAADVPHNCWKRNGTVGDRLTVAKGPPCCPGGGSIKTSTYHGFLRDGRLVPT